ncbi:Myc-type, basic helix-loop-helix domain-containing protein [Tanacetum coccineum]
MLPYFQHNSCLEVSFPFPSTLYQQNPPNPDRPELAGLKRSYTSQPQEDHVVIMDNDVDKEKKKKKMVHREIEKKRRQEMSNLYSSLRSLLPLPFIKGKRSTCEQVNQAVDYIKHLEEKIKGLSTKRDELKKMCNVVSDAKGVLTKNDKSERVMVECSQNDPITVTVSCRNGGTEILVKSNGNKGFQISRVLKALVQEGNDVISCNSTKVNEKLLIYSIHSKVIDEKTSIQESMLQQKLAELVNSAS